MSKFATSTQAEPYPAEMRTQLWPLCCGAAILSGFKDAAGKTDEELLASINKTFDEMTPDHQVYVGEQMRPKLTFLTLNAGQAQSPKIMKAVTAAGFKLFATAAPRGSTQSFFYRDMSETFKAA